MSTSVTDNPSRQKIQQLLDAVGVESEEDTKCNIDAYDYNWNQCRYFNSSQLKELAGFTEKVAQSCARKLTQFYHSDFSVSIVSTTQHFASDFMTSGKTRGDYYLAFGTNPGQPSGLIGIPSQTAIVWATELLGDSKSAEDSDRNLSPLEESLLHDSASGIAEALSESSDHCDFQPAAEIVKDQMPIELKGHEELCKITFSVKKSDSKAASEAYFLILCSELQPAMEENATAQVLSAKDTSNAMLNHIYEVPVLVKAQLDSTVFTFEDIMNLGVGDVLLLDKKTDEPIDLIAEDRILFRGWPAESAGKYAVVITETAYNTK
jgi:flagellar motor switch protein FliM